jgi:Ca-activated chloride channel family protein
VTRFRRGIWCALALVGWLEAAGACDERRATSDEPRFGKPIRLDEVQGGTLLFPTAETGTFAPAPALEADVAIAVTGAIVRAQVTQRFVNPTSEWLEGVYVFPLPDTAAVDHLRMLVGPRIIEGEIREREEAKKVYQAAKAGGRKASLVEQERPNIFTSSVANVGPGETVEITIEYQDTVPFDGVEFVLRFPLVVARRYVPGTPPDGGVEAGGATLPADACLNGRAQPTDVVPDAGRVTPPLSSVPVNPVRLSVEIDPGMALKWLYSPSHPVVTEPIGAFVHLVSLADDAVPADRDFVLVWAPAAGALPQATLLAEQIGDEIYALLTVIPPDAKAAAYRIARETVFVIDTSGSMAGQSIEQAKLALLIALDRLDAGDRFNIIQFNHTLESLFPHSVRAEEANVATARTWVESLGADGGTEMLSAIEAALADAAAPDEVRQVVFITDGQVSDEERLFTTIERRLGDSRLFTVGIGAAPNGHFMRKAAQFGRGTFTYVGSPQEVSSRMDDLFRKLESPKLADIEVDWGSDADAWPERVPDLYGGEPLVLAAKLSSIPDQVVVSGRTGADPWRVVIHRPPMTDTALASAGIGQLWARRKIESLLDHVVDGSEADRDAVRRAVIEVALHHHMVTNYTSLVAVDVTPTAPGDARLLTHNYPVNAPHGSALRLPSTATPARLYLVLAGLLRFTAWVLRPTAPSTPGGRRSVGAAPAGYE